MSKLRLYGSTSGYNELTVPAVADNSEVNIAGFTSNGYAASTFVANNNVVTVDTVNNRLGVGTASPSTELDVNGTITDDVSDVRIPRYTSHSGGDLTVSDEGVYMIIAAATLTTLTLGTPVAGSIICVYNNKTTAITLASGTTVTSMRIGADNNNTHNATLTLGAKSLTTITVISSTQAVVTGTDVT